MKKRLPVLIIILAAAGLAGYFFYHKTDTNADIRVSGNIEITDVQLGFKVAGKLAFCRVDEGDAVSKGDLLAQLEDTDQKILVSLAQASLDRARSVLTELEAGSRTQEIELSYARVLQARQVLLELTRGSRSQEIKSAAAQLETALAAQESAQVQLVQAKADAERFARLYKQENASLRDFEHFKTQYEVAQGRAREAASQVSIARQGLSLLKEGPRAEQIEKARAALMQAEAEYDLVKEGPRPEKIVQAKASVAEALSRLQQAKQQLEDTKLYAPLSGIVLSRSADPGEFLNPATPVLTVGDLAHPWLRAYVTETNLGRIHLKDKARVFTDAFPGKGHPGTLSFISSEAEFTPKAVQTFEERVKLMFRIKIDLANPEGTLKPGMPADAVILQTGNPGREANASSD